jgi:hypothetical protein
MAGEARGDCLEAFVGLALEPNGSLSSLPGSSYSHHSRPPGVYKDLDFYWTHRGALTAVLMATHTAAEKDWSRKFWRNVDELLEAKLSTASCVVGSVIWESFTKAGLDALWEAISDFEIVLQGKQYPVLARSMTAASTMFRGVTSFEQKIAVLKAVPGILQEAQKFASVLNQNIRNVKTKRSPLVSALAGITSRSYPTGLPTSNVRAQLNRLFCLDDPTIDFVTSISGVKKPNSNVDSQLATRLGALSPGLGGFRRTQGMNELLQAVPKAVIQRLLTQVDSDVRLRFRNEARNLLVVSKKLKAWQTFWDGCPGSSDVTSVLQDDVTSPGQLLGLQLETPWFFSFFLNFAKAYHDKKNDFGYGWLERERASTSAIRFWAPAYLRRTPIPTNELPTLTKFMVSEVGRWRQAPQKWAKAVLQVEEFEEHNVLTNKVDCHSSDPDPTSLVIEDFLQRERPSNWSREQSLTVLNDLAAVNGAGTLTTYRSGGTLLIGRSVTDGGREHKVKELAGFCRCHLFESSRGTIAARRGVQRRILIYDGSYRDTDFQHLANSGFDSFIPAAGLLSLSWSQI